MVDDGQQPVARRAPRRLIALGAAPEGEEGVLDHVLCTPMVAQDMIGQAIGHLAMPLVEHGEGGSVLDQHTGKERLVGRATSLCSHRLGQQECPLTLHL